MIDKRRKLWRNRYRNLAIVFIALIIGLVIMGFSFRAGQGHKIEMLDPKVIPEATPTPTYDPTSDPLSYIRHKGEAEGYDDYTISKFIRIARAESGFYLDPLAQNPISTSSGIYQFTDGTWARYCVGDKLDFVDSVNCFYHVLESDGYPKGLSHWASSRSKWE